MHVPTPLLHLLAHGAEVTQHEAARRTGLSLRTVRRHLTRLVAEGKVVARRKGGFKHYRLLPEHQPLDAPTPAFTEAEAEALTVATLVARSVLAPTPFAEHLETARLKLEQNWIIEAMTFEPDLEPERWAFDDATGGSPPPFEQGCFRTLLRAIRERRPVVATYYTASRRERSTGRRLHPLGMSVRHGSWLLTAFCCRDARVKDFAVAGFEAAELLEDETFEPPRGFDLDTHVRDRFGALSGEPVETVRLLVEPEAAAAFARKRYAPTQLIEEEHPDGRIVVSFEVELADDLVAWCLSWGAKLRVLEPAELAERVAEGHRRALERYAPRRRCGA